MLLSGTPGQVKKLIPDAENGLFSRFMYCHLPMKPQWNDVFADSTDVSLDEKVDLICEDVDFHTALTIGDILLEHAAKLYSILPVSASGSKQGYRLTGSMDQYQKIPLISTHTL